MENHLQEYCKIRSPEKTESNSNIIVPITKYLLSVPKVPDSTYPLNIETFTEFV